MYSLPDWAFYPIAALAVAGMVAGALSYGDNSERSPEEILTDGILFEGDSLNAITTGNGLSARILREGEETFARIDAVRGPFDGMQSAGAFFALSPGELDAIQGRRVRLRFTVRSAPEFGAPGIRLNFFVPGFGQDSGEHVEISERFETFTLEAASPECSWEFGYIGMWPDWDFEHNTVDLERVELTALDRLPDC
ncbi:hypothetical protein [uncultured Maricaulis sp.]|uniref:hypothetical protein n=1 Tax=uncultured Maricaulis sp. TaxID=174710 RepID=UPI0030D71BA5|tara:strand:- start:91852 stop:92436 length:585 start_codon:yes stop_codon:yes gene_type:complete